MKSVLVIDTPDICEACPISYAGTDANDNEYIGCQRLEKIVPIGIDKPDWCPLKPLPIKETYNPYDFEHYKNGYCKGWSDCIERITGE